MWRRGVKNVDLSECVFELMTISLKQVDIIMGKHYEPHVTTNQKPTIDTQKRKRK